MCGMVRRKPKLAPEAISIRLFGPGVTEVTKAKAIRREEQVGSHARNTCHPVP